MVQISVPMPHVIEEIERVHRPVPERAPLQLPLPEPTPVPPVPTTVEV